MADPVTSPDPEPNHDAQPRPAAAHIVVEAPPRWDRLLEAAGGASPPKAQEAPAAAPFVDPAAMALPWIRALVPLVLVVVYVGYKITHAPPPEPRRPDIEVVRSLAGVSVKPVNTRMNSETQALVTALQTRVEGRNWSGIMNAVAIASPDAREHPVVQAYDAVARVETGEGGADLVALVRVLEQQLAGDEEREPLVNYLRLAQLIVAFREQGNSADSLLRLTGEKRPVLAALPTTARVVEFRLMLAERFERFGQAEEAEAAGTFTNDEVKLSTARQLYQQGLRWVVAREGWLSATPIAPGKPGVVVERLLLRLRTVNAKINGWSVPMTQSDSSTWTGRAGDPIHDAPGGTW